MRQVYGLHFYVREHSFKCSRKGLKHGSRIGMQKFIGLVKVIVFDISRRVLLKYSKPIFGSCLAACKAFF